MIMETADSRQQTADSRQQTADSRQQTADSRCHYFDFLRVVAAFGVIVLHVSTWRLHLRDSGSLEFSASLIFTYMCEWAVPVFVMISGALFLGREIPLRKIYGKYIFRIFTAFLFWSFVYAVMWFVFRKAGFTECLKQFVRGNYHMWFLFMIVWMYTVIPMLKRIAVSERLAVYFLALWFVSFIAVPQSARMVGIFSKNLSTFINEVIDNFHLCFTMGYTGYFILGYILHKTEITAKTEHFIYAAGVLSFLTSFVVGVLISKFTGRAYTSLRGNTMGNFFESTAIFVFFMKHFRKGSRFAEALSRYSFGAYLVHDAVIQFVLKICRIDTFSFTPLISIPVISVIVFVISFAISAVINHIPILKKYIV